MGRIGYVYKIENKINGKIYIGQTIQPPNIRKSQHLSDLKLKRHGNPYLQHAFDKYGQSNFKFQVINWVNSQEELDKQETYFIKKFGSLSRNKGYNLKEGGNGGKLPEETKRKISLSKKGKLMGKDNPNFNNRGIKNPLFGKKHPPTWKSINGKNNPMYGKKRPIADISNIIHSRKVSGTFGYKGVHYYPRNKSSPFGSKIGYNKHYTFLGIFPDPISPHLVYEFAKNEIYGGEIR